ncbi:MAG TPA: hypothetical protein VII40_01970 [Xanthobacteraceae bacterium]
MEKAGQLQCNALRGLQKSRRRRNNGKQWKKQCAEQWKQSEIRARADVRLYRPKARNGAARESPPDEPGAIREQLLE